jgi:hypothetical protein
MTNATEAGGSDAASNIGADSPHCNLGNLSLRQAELRTDFRFVGFERGEKANVFDLAGGELLDPAPRGLHGFRLPRTCGLRPPVACLATSQVSTEIPEVPWKFAGRQVVRNPVSEYIPVVPTIGGFPKVATCPATVTSAEPRPASITRLIDLKEESTSKVLELISR